MVLVEDLHVVYRRTVSGAGLSGLFRRRKEQVHALRGVSFQVGAGEILGYIGPNGAGKTTTLKVLAGTLRPQRGKVQVLGFVPWRRERAFRQAISFVMSGRGLLEELTWDLPVADGFLLVRDLYGLSEGEFRRTRDELVELLGLEELLRVPLRQLSHGQRAKVELAAALLWRPRVLLLDEPTLGLDLLSQAALRRFIRDYVRRTEAACIVTSHYMRDIEDLCHRTILIHRGEAVAQGPPEELARRLSGRRKLRLVFDGEPPQEGLSALGEVLEEDGPEVVLSVPAERARDVVEFILREFSVLDLTLEEPDLEEAIRDYLVREGRC